MPVIKVASAAEEDLKEIWAYVAENNPEAAGRLVKEITRRFAFLRDHPYAGREQDKLLVGLRSFVVKTTSSSISPSREGSKYCACCTARGISEAYSRASSTLFNAQAASTVRPSALPQSEARATCGGRGRRGAG